MSTGTDFTDGLMLLDDIEAVSNGLANGDWLNVTIGSVSAGLSVLDPIGTLFENGAGWLLEHLHPLSTMLDELTGDPAQVAALAQSWGDLSVQLQGTSEDLIDTIIADLAEFEGLTFDAYRGAQGENAALIDSISVMCDSVRASLENAGQMVQAVHDLVRDVLATIVGMILSLLATWWIPIYGQAKLIANVGEAMLDLAPMAVKAVDAIKHAFGLLQDLLGSAADILRNIPGAETLMAAVGIGGRHTDDVVDAARHVPHGLHPGARGEDLLVSGNRYGDVDGIPIKSQAEWDELFTYVDEAGMTQTRWPNPAEVPGTVRNLTPEEFIGEYGTQFDRIGPEGGRWFSPMIDGQPFNFESRALPPSSLDLNYTQMSFDPSALPQGWTFKVSEVAPGLGQPGGAVQFQVFDSSGNARQMIDLLEEGGAVAWPGLN